jgi:predicted RNA-binding Zn-ribbon protein involved in translation (DUF1610 family)
MEKKKAFENPQCMRCDTPLEIIEKDEEFGIIVFKCPYCGVIEYFTPCEEDEKEDYAFYNEEITDNLSLDEHGYHGLCPQCGRHIIWGADFMRSEILCDVYDDDDDSLASSVSCPHCGSRIDIIEAKPSEYKNYPMYSSDYE